MLDSILSAPNSAHTDPPMDSFHFGSSPPHTHTKTEDAMDVPFSFDDDLSDHRKRRRNRTTQSCWSCHQAKRKCDRKRPCSRCIQLGLTGLCVYETDDPNNRDDPSMSETQRLRRRIAELEALVREMKNKPQPRWADRLANGGAGMSVDKWHTRGRSASTAMSPPGMGGGGGVGDGLDDYPYRFPPIDSGGEQVTVSSITMDEHASRRPSITSSLSSSSSPRTPFSYSNQPTSGITANPCSCLTSNTTRALASAVRSVILDSGIAHPYSEGCKVLALVRELEVAANTPPPSAISISSITTPSHHTQSQSYFADPHSNLASPNPSSSNSTASSPPSTSLPHPLVPSSVPSHAHASAPRSHSYNTYPSLMNINSMSLGGYSPTGSHQHHHDNRSHSIVNSGFSNFGLGYPSSSSNGGQGSSLKQHSQGYPLGIGV